MAWTRAAVVMGSLLMSLAESQLGAIWTFPDLFAKADFVVIGRVTAVRDTGRVVPHPNLRPALPMIEMEADIAVELVLKGAAAGVTPSERRLVLKYYRRDLEGWTGWTLNGGSTLKLEVGKDPYAMFLKRDGERYEPLSGHTFPTDSVFLLTKLSGG